MPATTETTLLPPPFSKSKWSELLISYFYSGWAFLIPYLATYLLYAWLKWPVNPVEATGTQVSALRPPCLLHVYWFLHALHLILASWAQRTWWRKSCAALVGATDNGKEMADSATPSQATMIPHGDNRPPPDRSPRPSLGEGEPTAHRLQSTVYRLVPWLLLGLIFWIPGLYLEWPSDPWEHLRRINEWHAHSLVTEHSSWTKSSYFLPYTLTGHTTGLVQLSWLNLYYVGICLLLCWQYYRLVRAVGLGERASFLFVLLQALLMGNSVFSFYRYYGLSSSIYAQLGAVALTRIAVEYCSGLRLMQNRRQGASRKAESALSDTCRSSFQAASTLIALLVLIAFNHVQGLGIAGLGMLAVVVWRLIEWKRTMIGWLAGAAIGLSVATVFWFPRHSALNEIYRPQGWLTPWYGFNLFTPGSPAFDRAYQIIGAFGVINLVASLWLLRRNHVVGWLTAMPVLALVLPCFGLPLAHVLAARGSSPDNIITFQRFFFSVPVGLALVILVSRWWSLRLSANDRVSSSIPQVSDPASDSKRYIDSTPPPAAVAWRDVPAAILFAALAGVVVLSPGSSGYNRFWHNVQITPDDLQLRHFVAYWTPEALAQAKNAEILTIDSPLAVEIQEAFLPGHYVALFRLTHSPFDSAKLVQRLAWVDATPEAFVGIRSDGSNGTPKLDEGLSLRRAALASSVSVIAVPTAANNRWLAFSGHPAEQEFVHGRLTLSNSLGTASNPFSPDLIPVSHHKRYRLTSTIRQAGAPSAISYLAVAWYDKDANVLTSNEPMPKGANNPLGWSNGNYSYYGLSGQSTGPSWENYSISFGFGEAADVPVNAVYLRTGALLNYQGTPATRVELTDIILEEKPPHEHLFFVAPGFRNLNTPASLAAFLSGHWGPQHVGMKHAGTEELQRNFATAMQRLKKYPE